MKTRELLTRVLLLDKLATVIAVEHKCRHGSLQTIILLGLLLCGSLKGGRFLLFLGLRLLFG
jgi:hypothetical protein